MPPGRIVHVPGRGELFVRDSGGEGPVVLLLHGWMVSADLNWWRMYAPLSERYRVVALDHRGHGRGLRTPKPFRLEDCAEDAAALLRHLGSTPAVAVGYSMGGPIAQLIARDNRDVLSGVVLCATSREWTDWRLRLFWRTMALLRLLLALFPNRLWRFGLRQAGFPDSAETTWAAAELSRGSALDVAEAGREIGRFDSRPWIGRLKIPAAVVVTARDRQVPPGRQRELAVSLGARTFDVEGDHMAAADLYQEFEPQLLAAIASVLDTAEATLAPAEPAGGDERAAA